MNRSSAHHDNVNVTKLIKEHKVMMFSKSYDSLHVINPQVLGKKYMFSDNNYCTAHSVREPNVL